ncbi:hypothetical protein J5N97_007666 [Dioscorea zingiberensis]|uniref:CHCH domain-containing protein n=1 Tax=Dioscorea zingiberensis TaxID=325984 RepID=A0A9D5HTW4_9LILI|nr:hypothetical protein J5N97_007666 [Dioscorea zingiberensis]
METITSNPVCAKEALDLLNCAAASPFDRAKCLRFLDALRDCILEKKVKNFSLVKQSQAGEFQNSKGNSELDQQ